MQNPYDIIRAQIWMDAGDEPGLTATRIIEALAAEGLTIQTEEVKDPTAEKERIKKEIAAELGVEFE